jgi:hypothetical protein
MSSTEEPSSSAPSSIMTPKVVREIEEEIARSTQQFDEWQVSGKPSEIPQTSAFSVGDDELPADQPPAHAALLSASLTNNNKQIPAVTGSRSLRSQSSAPLQTHHVLTLARIALILILGVVTGDPHPFFF